MKIGDRFLSSQLYFVVPERSLKINHEEWHKHNTKQVWDLEKTLHVLHFLSGIFSPTFFRKENYVTVVVK